MCKAVCDVQAHNTASELYIHRALSAAHHLKRYYLSTRLHGVTYSSTKLPVHRATPMVRVTFRVPLLLLVLILRQSHEDSNQFSYIGGEGTDFETYIKGTTEPKQQIENSYGECKVSIYAYIINIYIYINH